MCARVDACVRERGAPPPCARPSRRAASSCCPAPRRRRSPGRHMVRQCASHNALHSALHRWRIMLHHIARANHLGALRRRERPRGQA
eukprot:scaffold62109_cov54-Phaeocystis_antarctica.AAC.8